LAIWCFGKEIFYIKMDQHSLSLCSFNCRSIKSFFTEVCNLCDSCDFIFNQEHWLFPDELHILNTIHSDFYGVGYSAVELSNDNLSGKPYGGICILYRKSLAQYVNTVNSYDPRITAVSFNSNSGSIITRTKFRQTTSTIQIPESNVIKA